MQNAPKQTNTGEICHISERAKSNTMEWPGMRWLEKFYPENGENMYENTTLNGFKPMKTLTFRSVVQRGTTEPAIATDKTIANLCNLHIFT